MSIVTYDENFNADELQSDKPEIISFQTIRRAIGWLAILLPFVLILGSSLCGNCCVIQPSVSHYYYTNMHDIFVGAFCAMSLFMFSYKGYTKTDSWAANLAGLFGLGNALIPCNPICNTYGSCYYCQTNFISFISFSHHDAVHYTFAGLFLGTFAYMSLFLFTKSEHDKSHQTKQKRKRNVVYKVCGIIIIFCIVSIFAYKKLFHPSVTSIVTFWLETLATVAFGISWLTKGEALLGDHNK